MGKKWLVFLVVVIILVGGGFFAFDYLSREGASEFEIDTLFLKVAIRKGGEAISNVRVTNTASRPKHFLVGIENMQNIVSIKEERFSLFPNEDQIVEINFSSNRIHPGVFLGQLEIFSDKESEVVPIILEVQSDTVLFDSNINLFPTGADVLPGQKLSAEVKIFDIGNVGTNNVDVTYHIKDFEGGTVASETERLVVDNKLTFTKTINLPSNLAIGDYVFIVITEFDGFVGTSSMFFSVGEDGQERGWGWFSEENTFYLLLGGLFFVFLFLLIYSLVSRDKLLMELQRQFREEMRKQNRLIREGMRIRYTKLKTPIEKKEYRKEVDKVKRLRQAALKKIQDRRVEKYKKIKRGGKKENLQKQLKTWKAEGYDTSSLEKKYKLPEVSAIREKIKKWKAQGYDTSVLERKKEFKEKKIEKKEAKVEKKKPVKKEKKKIVEKKKIEKKAKVEKKKIEKKKPVKKEKRKSEVQKKIEEWKKKGYDTSILENK